MLGSSVCSLPWDALPRDIIVENRYGTCLLACQPGGAGVAVS